jgi:hypothetical protein
MIEQDLVARDSMFCTWVLNEDCLVVVKNIKASAACEESQTWLALVCSLAAPYNAKYPLNQSDTRPLHGF